MQFALHHLKAEPETLSHVHCSCRPRRKFFFSSAERPHPLLLLLSRPQKGVPKKSLSQVGLRVSHRSVGLSSYLCKNPGPYQSLKRCLHNLDKFMNIFGCGSKPMVPFWGRRTTHFRAYFSGDWDVHWGYDLAFDLGPGTFFFRFASSPRGWCDQKDHQLLLGVGLD